MLSWIIGGDLTVLDTDRPLGKRTRGDVKLAKGIEFRSDWFKQAASRERKSGLSLRNAARRAKG